MDFGLVFKPFTLASDGCQEGKTMIVSASKLISLFGLRNFKCQQLS